MKKIVFLLKPPRNGIIFIKKQLCYITNCHVVTFCYILLCLFPPWPIILIYHFKEHILYERQFKRTSIREHLQHPMGTQKLLSWSARGPRLSRSRADEPWHRSVHCHCGTGKQATTAAVYLRPVNATVSERTIILIPSPLKC
jgi:hypothetical protein